MKEGKKRGIVAGLAVIALGLGLWYLQFAEGLGRGIFVVMVGGAFVAGYLYTRGLGLLIPGCLILSMGLGSIGERSFFPPDRSDLIPLGLGFIAIFVVPLIYERRSVWWPLIPGGILIVLGFPEAARVLRRFLDGGWPLIVVAVGLLILLGAVFRGGSSSSARRS